MAQLSLFKPPPKDCVLSFRVDQELYNVISALSVKRSWSVSQVARWMLQQYVLRYGDSDV